MWPQCSGGVCGACLKLGMWPQCSGGVCGACLQLTCLHCDVAAMTSWGGGGVAEGWGCVGGEEGGVTQADLSSL